MSLIILATTAAVCSLSVDPLCGYELPSLIANGGFETGDLTGWTLDCPDGGCAVEPTLWGSNQFRRVVLSNQPARLSQILTLPRGLFYVNFVLRDSSVAFNPAINRVSVEAGQNEPAVFDIDFDNAYDGRYFAAAGGPTNLAFEFQVDDGLGSFAFDNVGVEYVDDGGAALSTDAALAAAHEGSRRFVETIFAHNGAGHSILAARPVATSVAGPAKARTARTRSWVSGSHTQAQWDEFETAVRENAISGGVEMDAGGGWTAGFAADVADRNTQSLDVISQVSSDGYAASFAIFGTFAPDAAGSYFQAAAGGGWSTRDHLRTHIFGAEPAVAVGAGGSHWFAAAEAGYRFNTGPKGLLTPYLRLAAIQAHEDRFFEVGNIGWSGASVVDAAVRDSLSSQAGVRGQLHGLIEQPVTIGYHAAWRHEFADTDGINFAYTNHEGPGFNLTHPGTQFIQDSAIFGIEIETAVWDQTSIFVRYDGEASDGHNVNSGQGGLRTVW